MSACTHHSTYILHYNWHVDTYQSHQKCITSTVTTLLTIIYHTLVNKTFEHVKTYVVPPSLPPCSISCAYDSISWGGPQWSSWWTFGGFTPIPKAIVAIRTQSTESASVNEEMIDSFTNGCVPLVYMSTSLNWGRSGYPLGLVNLVFNT